jgi:hypothetical protein
MFFSGATKPSMMGEPPRRIRWCHSRCLRTLWAGPRRPACQTSANMGLWQNAILNAIIRFSSGGGILGRCQRRQHAVWDNLGTVCRPIIMYRYSSAKMNYSSICPNLMGGSFSRMPSYSSV